MKRLSIANTLADFITNLEYDDLPKGVIDQAKRCLLDTIGVILAGSRTDTGNTFISIGKDFGGAEEATIFGSGRKVHSINAALVNGTLGHIHELDDGHRLAAGHPGTTSIPAAIAIAEKLGASGEELITSIVLGYDTFIRIARAINPSHLNRGFHTTGTCGTFGAAVAASKIMGLNKKETVNALGLAGLQAAGLMEVMHGESWAKPFNAGRASHNGALAALLAERGITAPKTIFEGENGFFKAYSDKFDVNKVLNGLGEDYQIMGIYTKLHASCRHTHPAIDCVIQLSKEYMIAPENVEKVIVKTYSLAYKLTGTEYEPKTESTAKFSIPFCTALAMTYGIVGPEEFTKDKIKNKQLLQLARKVKVEVDPNLDKLVPDKRGASVEIFLKNGELHRTTMENPIGEPVSPIDNKKLREKFIGLAGTMISNNNLNNIIKRIDELEYLSNINDLTILLS